jgi:Peptidase family M1 domain
MKKFYSLIILITLAYNCLAQATWQQQCNYEINVTLIDTLQTLKGNVAITYINNSPDTLRFIYIHVYPNAYKNDRTEYNKQMVEQGNTNFYFSKASEKGNIRDLKFMVNNQEANVSEYNGYADILLLDLPEPILPNSSAVIYTPFTVKIPKIFSRLGHFKNNFQLTQWYPKPAVYDASGWHPMPYLDQGEFYSDFGNYKVNITVPENYVVAATGELQTPSEIKWLESKIISSTIVDTIALQNVKLGVIKNTDKLKTIQFTQNNVHDFAWFADKRFVIEKDSVLIENKNVATYIYYLPENYKLWHGSCDAIKTTLAYISAQVGAYKYSSATVVDGNLLAGAGMEYPMITVIGNVYESKQFLTEVIVHEIGHNWFQGMLANNERLHAFLDEGCNTFYENKITAILNAEKEKKENPGAKKIDYERSTSDLSNSYVNKVNRNKEQAINNNARLLTESNYNGGSYNKFSFLLTALEQYLGDSIFKKSMQQYFTTYALHHPTPKDLQNTFENIASQKLDFIFNHGINTTKYCDYKIKNIAYNKGNTHFDIINKGTLNMPLQVVAYQSDSIVYTTTLYNTLHKTGLDIKAKADKIIIDPQYYTLDINRKNNTYNRNTLFKTKRLSFKFLKSSGIQESSIVNYYPAIGYNYYNGLMLGLGLHNISNLQLPFQYYITPMLGLHNKQLCGMAGFNYFAKINKFVKNIISNINMSSFAYNSSKQNIDTRLFNNFYRIVPSVQLQFNNAIARLPIQNNLTAKAFFIYKNSFNYSRLNADSIFKPTISNYKLNTIAEINFEHLNDRTFNPFSFKATAQGNAHFAKLSAEAKLTMHYNKPNKALYVRAFAGKVFNFNTAAFYDNNYYLAGTHNADNDYTFSNYYIGRSVFNNVLNRQIDEYEGGLKINTEQLAPPVALSNNILFAVNISSDLPIKLPFKLKPFFDFCTYKNSSTYTNTSFNASYDGGIQFILLKDIVKINVPLIYSSDYSNYLKSTYSKQNKFWSTITFSLNLNDLNARQLPVNFLNY